MPVMYGAVGAPSTTSAADGTNLPAIQGKQGEILDAKLHGDFYTQAYRGNLFFATTATAGTIIPVQASALVSTFTLFNPANSAKNLELVSYSLGIDTTGSVVSDVSLWFQSQIGSVNTQLATLTNLTVYPGLLGGSFAAQGQCYSAAKFIGTLLKGPTMVTFGTTTSPTGGVFEYNFNGRIILPPGTAVTTAGNAAQTVAMQQTFFWVESPI